MIEDEEQPQLLNTIGESPTEEVGTIEEDIYVLGVESLNGKTGNLSIKTINGEDLVEEGNIDLQTPLDSDQMAAVNSGIDSTKVSQIATNTQNITTLQNTKQDKLTQTQLNAVNSGIDQTKVAQIATNTGNITSNTNRITTIEGKIPSAASSSNQLTDKNYVDNSIATNTANYISDNGMPFQSYADLEAYSGPLTNNDYAFVVSTDAAGNLLYTRYKYNASQELWAEEYTIANPTFTADQWAAINSGVTQNDVNQIDTNKGDIAGLQTSKQDALSQTQLDAINSGIDATKVQQISDNTTAIATKQDKLVAGANIQIGSDGKTISATDTTYTAGTGLTLTGTQFSVTEPVPAGFFTDTAAEQTGTGSSITLNNTVDAPIDKAELKGDTFQFTTTGKNLFGAGAIATVYRCSASINDNILTVEPTGSGAPQVRIDLLSVIPAGSYTLNSVTPLSTTTQLTAEGGTETVYNFGSHYNSVQFTTTAPAGRMTFNIADYSATTTIDLNTLQIEAGNQATSYEPYTAGASPNPDYPQGIQVVTGEQTVSVVGKNLLPLVSQSFDQGSLHYSVDAGRLKLTGSRNVEVQKNASVFKNNFSFKLAAGTYTVSCTETGSKSGTINLYLLNKADDSTLVTITKNGSNSLTLAQETEIYLGIYSYQLTITDSVLYALQIEQGSAPSAWQSYQSQSYTIDLGATELCKIGTYQDYIWKDGDTWKTHKETSKAVFDSTNVSKITQTSSNHERYLNAVANTIFTGLATGSPSYQSYCSHYSFVRNGTAWQGVGKCGFDATGTFWFMDSRTSLTTIRDWFSSEGVYIYYPIATPTDTAITDATLIAQLEALAGSRTYSPQTNYSVLTPTPNLPAILTVDVFKNNYAGLLARLNKAGA